MSTIHWIRPIGGWAAGKRPRSPGYSLRTPWNEWGTSHATFNRNLGDVLDGRRIIFGMDLNNRVVFRFEETDAWAVRRNQVTAVPLWRLDVPPNTRLWFEFDDSAALFRETRREAIAPAPKVVV